MTESDELTCDECTSWLRTTMTDLRYAFRQLIKSPSFSATAIFALALGIGATTAMFAVIYAFLLRPLPYAEPEKLVMLQSRSTRSGSDLGVNYLDFVDWQKQSRSFSDHGVFQSALERKPRIAATARPKHSRPRSRPRIFSHLLGVAASHSDAI